MMRKATHKRFLIARLSFSGRQKGADGTRHDQARPRLQPAKDVAVQDERFVALSPLPWLRITQEDSSISDTWIRIAYATSWLDPLVRPLLRCWTSAAYDDQILPAALFGRAFWIGHIPKGTKEIWIAPTNRPGPFSFSLELFERIPPARLIGECLKRNPHRCLIGLGAHILGLSYASKTQFRRTLAATPLYHYDAWRKRHMRALDVKQLDAPRADWRFGPHLRLLMTTACEPSMLTALVAGLRQQPYPKWSLRAPGRIPVNDLSASTNEDNRQIMIASSENFSLPAFIEDLAPSDLIISLAPGEVMPSYALAVLAEAAQRHPQIEVFSGDEDQITRDGTHIAPRLNADWNPLSSPQILPKIYVRAGILSRTLQSLREKNIVLSLDKATEAILGDRTPVHSIRRILRTCPHPRPQHNHLKVDTPREFYRGLSGVAVAIVIPTRDNAGLLEKCIASLMTHTDMNAIEVLIVDNDSTKRDAKKLLADLGRQSNFKIIPAPGPFNFAKMCNDAANATEAAVLCFLNNDIEALHPHWLERLVFCARRPDVGAAGAKLIYPNGRVQHAGVVLGIDGRAAHFERAIKYDDPGYFGRLCTPNPVSAVTGACLVLEKQKFLAVNGFDSENLPIELNDIDLCLRLNERGWTNVLVPSSILVHHECASRGRTLRPEARYKREHAYFRERWINRLRDDPFFHPALSLDSLTPALG